MAQTFHLRDTASDLGGGADFSNQLLEATGADGDIIPSVKAGTTEISFGFTEPGVPGANGATGNYTIEVEVEAGSTEMQLSVQLHRVDSSGAIEVGGSSGISAEQTGSAGVKSFSFLNPDLGTWAAGNRLRVDYRLRSTATHGSTSITIGANTTDQEVVTPFTAPASGSTVSRNVQDILTFADSLARNEWLTRGLSDSFVFSDNLDATVETDTSGDVFTRNLQDTFTLSDSLLRDQQLVRALADVFAFSENLDATVTEEGSGQVLSRTLSEAFSFSDALERHAALTRALSDTFVFAEDMDVSGTGTFASTDELSRAALKRLIRLRKWRPYMGREKDELIKRGIGLGEIREPH